MKIKTIFLALMLIPIAIVSFSTVVSAKTFHNKSEGGNLYVGQENTTRIDQEIDNDLIYAGETLIYSGIIGDNLFAFGQSVQVDGDVKGDVLVIAANVIINGNVEGDVRVLAYNAYINSKKIGGDINIAAFNYGISNITEIAGSNFSGSENRIQSNLIPKNLSEIKDAWNFEKFAQSNTYRNLFAAFTLMSAIIAIAWFLGSLIVSYCILRFFPVFSEMSIESMKKQWLNSIAIGSAVLVLSPFIGFFLLISVIGWPIIISLGIFFVLSMLLSWVYFRYISGWFILKTLKVNNHSRIVTLLVGSVAVDLLFLLLAFTGRFGSVVTFLISFGVIAWFIGTVLIEKFKKTINFQHN